jgi:hypothetical protein
MAASADSISVAFIGATGGCTNACLTHTLKAGYKAIALARTPAKLTALVQTQGLDDATISSKLTIIQGDATDVAAVKRTIAPEQNGGKLVSQIVSGVGGSGKFQASLFRPVTLDNPHICEDTTNAVLAAVKEVQQQQRLSEQERPVLTIISTTGISDGKEDVPFGLRFLYHYILAIPHEDKRKMEKAAIASTTSSGLSTQPAPLKGVISVRPTLLMGDHTISSGKGWKALRAGTEEEPAVGYTVARADVGEWIFEEVVRTGGGKWLNKLVSLTN